MQYCHKFNKNLKMVHIKRKSLNNTDSFSAGSVLAVCYAHAFTLLLTWTSVMVAGAPAAIS